MEDVGVRCLGAYPAVSPQGGLVECRASLLVLVDGRHALLEQRLGDLHLTRHIETVQIAGMREMGRSAGSEYQ